MHITNYDEVTDVNSNSAYKTPFNYGITDIHIFYERFDALTQIIQNRSNIIMIEETLLGLNVNDIKNALIFKQIKSKIIIIKHFRKISPSKILTKIKTEFTLK